MPVASIVIPAYNAESTLDRTLISVLNQSLEDIEVIVVDDGSIDRTPAVVRRFARNDDRIRIIEQTNAGVAKARNAGIAMARSEWIGTVDADDIWHPRKIELQLQAANAAGDDTVMVYSWSRRIDKDDRVLSDMGTPRVTGDVLHQLIASNFMRNASSAMFRRDVGSIAGGFDPGLQDAGAQGAEDLKFYLALARSGRVAVAPYFLTGYRLIEGSMSQMAARMHKSIEMALAESEVVDTRIPPEVFALARMNYDLYAASLALRGGDRRAFLKYVLSAMSRRPVEATVHLCVNALWRASSVLNRTKRRPLFQDLGVEERMPMPLADRFGRFQAWSARRAASISICSVEQSREARE